jgi:hypothetical protein
MRRAELEHLLRAASQISGERDILVIGSQSILGTLPQDELPSEATGSRPTSRSSAPTPSSEPASSSPPGP